MLGEDLAERDARGVERQSNRVGASSNDFSDNLHRLATPKNQTAAERCPKGRQAPVFDLVPQSALGAVDHLVGEPADLEYRTLGEGIQDAIQRAS